MNENIELSIPIHAIFSKLEKKDKKVLGVSPTKIIDYLENIAVDIIIQGRTISSPPVKGVARKSSTSKRKRTTKKTTKKKTHIDNDNSFIKLNGYEFNSQSYNKQLDFYTKIAGNEISLIIVNYSPKEYAGNLALLPLYIDRFALDQLVLSPLPIQNINSSTLHNAQFNVYHHFGKDEIELINLQARIDEDLDNTPLMEPTTFDVATNSLVGYDYKEMHEFLKLPKAPDEQQAFKNLYKTDYVKICPKVFKVSPFDFFPKKPISELNFKSQYSSGNLRDQRFVGLDIGELKGEESIFLSSTNGNYLTIVNLTQCYDIEFDRNNKFKIRKALKSYKDFYLPIRHEVKNNRIGYSLLGLHEASKKGSIYLPVLKNPSEDVLGSYPFYSDYMNMHVFPSDMKFDFPDVQSLINSLVKESENYINTYSLKKKTVQETVNLIHKFFVVNGITKISSLLKTKGSKYLKSNTSLFKQIDSEVNFFFTNSSCGIRIRFQKFPEIDVSKITNTLLNKLELFIKKGLVKLKDKKLSDMIEVVHDLDNGILYVSLYKDEPRETILMRHGFIAKVNMYYLSDFLESISKFPKSQFEMRTKGTVAKYSDLSLDPLLFQPLTDTYLDNAITHVVMPMRDLEI
jgi:hypothetical protein